MISVTRSFGQNKDVNGHNATYTYLYYPMKEPGPGTDNRTRADGGISRWWAKGNIKYRTAGTEAVKDERDYGSQKQHTTILKDLCKVGLTPIE